MSVQLASVVVPIYNQAEHVRAIFQEYIESLARLDFPYELLPVVNGRRKDDSLEICRSLEKEFPCIRTLCIDEGGWGRAVRYGLGQARGDLLCYTNSARTTGRELLLFLLYGSIHEDCVIKANRRIRESLRRRFGSLLYNLECRALFDLPFWDVNGTPKVFPRAFEKLVHLQRPDDLIDLEFGVICRREEYQMIEVPIFSSRRHSGKSTTSMTSAFHMYWGAIQMRLSNGLK